MTPDQPPESTGLQVTKLFGAMLMAIGGLFAVLSGLCSFGVLGSVISNIIHSRAGNIAGVLMIIPLVALFGGVPFAIGAGLFIWGRSVYRGV